MKGNILVNISDVDDKRTGIEVTIRLERVNSLDKMLILKAATSALLESTAELDLFKAMMLSDFWPDGDTLAKIVSKKEATRHAN